MAKVDLKDAIPIHHKYLNIPGKILSVPVPPIRPVIGSLTKTLKPALALLREMGVRLIAYIDDILVLAESQEQAKRHAEAVVYLVQCLPAQVMGLTVDTVKMELKLPVDKIKKIRAESRAMMREKQVSGRVLAPLVGRMKATSPQHHSFIATYSRPW